MALNSLGLTAALTAFLSIWIGHVSVRKVEAVSVDLRRPIAAAIFLGLVLLAVSALTTSRHLAAVCGILAITLLWDAFELKRQSRRIAKGHAPANPNNPRHAAILAAPGSHATTLDLLNRDPLGRQVDASEAASLVGKPHRQEKTL